MKKKILISLSYILVTMLATVATLAAIGYPGYASGTKLEQLESLILERFIGDADQTAMEDAAAAAMVKSLGDRWSYYIPASEYDAHEEQVNNAYVGIGITIEAKEQEGFLVKAVNEGGPAGEAGVQVDDLVIEVEGQDVREMTAADVRNLVRGEEGTCVSLTVLRQGERVTLSVERRQVQTVVASGRMLTDKIGLVTIENFDSRCAEETIAAIDDLLGQGAEKLIFDVRNNPGGYAKELVKVLDYLLPEGELFRTVDYAGKENVDHSDADCLDIPMAVLVNGDSYSAAEFFAAALSEYGVADVVGEKTCGKGYFQNTIRLSDGSAVGLSVGKYFTPKGVSLAGVGITPDVVVPVDEKTADAIYYDQLEPEDDPQIQAALDLDAADVRGAHAVIGQGAVDLAALAAGAQVCVDHQQALGQRPGSHCAAVHLLLRAAEEGQHGCGEGEPCKALARDLHKLTAGHVSRQKISFCHRFHSSVEVTLRGAPQLHRNTSC